VNKILITFFTFCAYLSTSAQNGFHIGLEPAFKKTEVRAQNGFVNDSKLAKYPELGSFSFLMSYDVLDFLELEAAFGGSTIFPNVELSSGETVVLEEYFVAERFQVTVRAIPNIDILNDHVNIALPIGYSRELRLTDLISGPIDFHPKNNPSFSGGVTAVPLDFAERKYLELGPRLSFTYKFLQIGTTFTYRDSFKDSFQYEFYENSFSEPLDVVVITGKHFTTNFFIKARVFKYKGDKR